MNRSRFASYIDTYNSGSHQALLSFFTPGLMFQSFGRPPLVGDAAFSFLEEIHQDFKDRIVPVNTLFGDDLIALEAVLEQEARRDLPHFFGGARTKGQRSRMRIFVWYRTVGDLISSIRLTGWPEA